MELVDILTPPDFNKSGVVKTRNQAWDDGDWIGSFNLWIVQDTPTPAIIYQQRSVNSRWAPGKLDVTAGGAYKAGEALSDGLREVKEEIGKSYNYDDLTFLGRKLNLSPNVKGVMCHYVAHVYIAIDNSPLESYTLETNELEALYLCPIDTLIKCHQDKNYSFTANGLDNQGHPIKNEVSQASFPYNWDNYHFKMALLARRFLKGETNLIY